jgi:hypothetical protein
MELKTIQIIPENLFLCDDNDEMSADVLNTISDAINASQASKQDKPLTDIILTIKNTDKG